MTLVAKTATFSKLTKTDQAAAEHATDFAVPPRDAYRDAMTFNDAESSNRSMTLERVIALPNRWGFFVADSPLHLITR